MNNMNEKNGFDSRTFFKLIGALFGAFGGFAALFVAFGYITQQCFLSQMKLYGVPSFPLQFFKEATVTFLRETLDFYSGNPLFIISPVLIIGLPVIFRIIQNFQTLKPIFGILCLIVIPIIVFVTFALGILGQEYVPPDRIQLAKESQRSQISSSQELSDRLREDDLTRKRQENFLFAISLPVLVSLFLYLVLNIKRLDPKNPQKNSYAYFLAFFLLLFLVLPVGYGSYIYDIPVFTASIPECDSSLETFKEAAKNYKLLYLMGHTSEREIFFDATKSSMIIIIVDKKLVKSIKVHYSTSMTNSLRDLFRMRSENLFTMDPEINESIMGKSAAVSDEEANSWVPPETREPKIKKGEKND